MKALVFVRPEVVELQDLPEPEPGPGEVLVRVAACGICGSELHGIRHTDFRKPPLVLGHELSGTTPDGRRVTVNPLLSCGHCDACRRGDDHLCGERQILGIHRPGGFAELVAVPESAVHELPDGMSFEVAALIEPLANAVHALRLAAPDPGARIAVIGAGTIGLVCLQVALGHSSDVTVVDLAADRLEIARSLGAASAVTALEGEYDVIVDAVGAATTHRLSVDALRPGGVAVWVGLLSADPGFDGQEIVRHEKRVLGSYCYSAADFGAAVALAATLPLDWSTSFALDEGVDIFGQLMNGRHDVVKALLHPASS